MIRLASILQSARPQPRHSSAPRSDGGSACPLLSAILCLLAAGCASSRDSESRIGRTTFESPLVVLPAKNIGNQLIVELSWDRHGPHRFLIDTGSSVTLVSPDFARRYAFNDKVLADAPKVRVRSADGLTTLLDRTTIRRIDLGEVSIAEVPALIYDCSTLSAHYGLRIDGILGFPLFRQTVLTLDYPQSRIVLTPTTAEPLLPGSSVQFNNENRTPIIPVKLGDTPFDALIDSGSDAVISLNPVALEPSFAVSPREAGPVGTLTGSRTQRLGRLAGTVSLGGYALERPIVEVTDELSSIGGAALRNFSVTFDQSRNRVTFYRSSPAPVVFESRRSAGLAFNKSQPYWRVEAVIPGSPAARAGVVEGELVTRIDNEPVGNWSLIRYEEHVRTAREITFTFLVGRRETQRRLEVFDLVP